jgi:hypothetical protein
MARIRLPSVMIHRHHGHAHEHDHDHDHGHDHSTAPQSYHMLPQQELAQVKPTATEVSNAAVSDTVDLKDASFNTQVSGCL